MVELSCLCLTKHESAWPELSSIWPSGTPEIRARSPRTLEEARAMVRQYTVPFALAHFPRLEPMEERLSTFAPIRHLGFPPLIVIVDQPLAPAEKERLRIQGVAHVIVRPVREPDEHVGALRGLLRSGTWMSGSLEQMGLVDVLQLLGNNNQTAMVSIVDGVAEDMSTEAWGMLTPEGDSTKCIGRVYMRQGQLIRAETQHQESLPALAEMITRNQGTFRIHEVALPPLERNLTGSIVHNVMNATVLIDEQTRDGDVSAPRPKPSAIRRAKPEDKPHGRPQTDDLLRTQSSQNRPPPIPAVMPGENTETQPPRTSGTRKESQTMSDKLKTILSQGVGLTGAALSDRNGNVVEFAGRLDAESACAVVAMSSPSLETVESYLGMGSVKRWTVAGEKTALYVHRARDGFVVVVGASNPNIEGTSQKIDTLLEQSF
jgi:predicted regulator of Ras-like GTPase activity (Roadblock/LC7/MglB family)